MPLTLAHINSNQFLRSLQLQVNFVDRDDSIVLLFVLFSVWSTVNCVFVRLDYLCTHEREDVVKGTHTCTHITWTPAATAHTRRRHNAASIYRNQMNRFCLCLAHQIAQSIYLLFPIRITFWTNRQLYLAVSKGNRKCSAKCWSWSSNGDKERNLTTTTIIATWKSSKSKSIFFVNRELNSVLFYEFLAISSRIFFVLKSFLMKKHFCLLLFVRLNVMFCCALFRGLFGVNRNRWWYRMRASNTLNQSINSQ